MQIKLILTSLLVLCFSRMEAQTRVGYTSIENILPYMSEYPNFQKEIRTMEDRLTQEMEISRKNYDQKLREYLDPQYHKQLSPQAEAARQQELKRLEVEINTKSQASEEKLTRFRLEKLRPMQERIQAAINQVAREGGYTFILNNTMGGLPSILYGIEKDDVTVAICNKLGIKIPSEK